MEASTATPHCLDSWSPHRGENEHTPPHGRISGSISPLAHLYPLQSWNTLSRLCLRAFARHLPAHPQCSAWLAHCSGFSPRCCVLTDASCIPGCVYSPSPLPLFPFPQITITVPGLPCSQVCRLSSPTGPSAPGQGPAACVLTTGVPIPGTS